MNYETFYQGYKKPENDAKDALANLQRLFKKVARDMEQGDMKNAVKDVAALQAQAGAYAALTTELQRAIGDFDTAEYLQSGALAEQLVELCRAADIDIQGEGKVYEVFPCKVRIDAENADVYIDKKRFQYLRPTTLVQQLKTVRDKLMKSAFSPSAFTEELAAVYDLAILRGSKGNKPISPDADLYLLDLYKLLTPMRRFRKDYELQSFAFDLARLYASHNPCAKDGRNIQFGPSRDPRKSIRIFDANGQERFLTTIRFYVDNTIHTD